MYKNYIKRILDLIISISLLPIVAVVFIIVPFLIYSEDKGRIFYNAARLGKNKKVFNMHKFRSMKQDAPDLRNEDGSTYNSKEDSRVTKVGQIIRKLSLDELPQIINVIKGDMSIVGPRPDMPDAINIYKNDEIKKLLVKPGITGYNQAYYRNGNSQSERFKNDVFYVENISFTLDCKILIKTISTILFSKNIHSN